MSRLPILMLSLLLLSAPANASTVAVEGGVLRVTAAPGETNVVAVGYDDHPERRGVYVTDVAVSAGAGCRAEGGKSAFCPAAGISEVHVHGGDGDDRMGDTGMRPLPMVLRYFGGDGDDRLEGDERSGPLELRGEGGNDRLHDGPGADTLDGGPGDDRITAAYEETVDRIICGEGEDIAFHERWDTIAGPDCERLPGVGIFPSACKPRSDYACLVDSRWRIGLLMGGDDLDVENDRSAGRDASGTVQLRTHFRVTPPSGGSRRQITLGPKVRFSVRKNGSSLVRYPFNATARKLILMREGRRMELEAITVSRNQSGFPETVVSRARVCRRPCAS